MQLLPECFDALKYGAFWKQTEKPSLETFLEFRLCEGDLGQEEVEHNRYVGELNTILKYHAKTSEIGKEVQQMLKNFQAKRQNILVEIEFIEKKRELLEKEQNELKDRICLEQTRHVLDASIETRDQCLAVQKSITRKRLLNESSERTYKESMTESATLYLTPPMTEIASPNSDLGSLDGSKATCNIESDEIKTRSYPEIIADIGNNPFLDDKATKTSTSMINISNILNNPESSEVGSHSTSTILTIPHNYNISNISYDTSNEIVDKPIIPTTPPPYCKQPRFITNNEYIDMVWSPWCFYKIIGGIDIEEKIIGLCEKEKKAKIKSSLSYGIIDLNDSRIMNVLGPSVKVYFEAEMKKYKPQRSVSKEALETLKYFNVTSLSELGKALSNITINYENPNRDIVYLRHLFEKFSELQEGWYNSNIVAPFFDDCLASLNDCILRRGEVESKAQKLFGIKSSKKPKYDGILSFNRKIEFIYVETATTSILSKKDKDLSKLHRAIAIMFKLIVSSLPEKIVYEISDLPILCIQFCGTTADVYLANWPINMRPVVFSIFEFDIPEQITSLPSLTNH
ncbi:25020_t:CDS:10 [Racocetra persica]|uniref:25020_t:CDS:1 n=1 Tax=Racocetra persica TaxID=160502 RepID=A0ACA9L642_9GLOM|nr:25020_t:CDS:10 [Racocetra persica]